MQYGVQGSGTTQTMIVNEGAITESMITGLTPSTTYSIEVAVVNSAGSGVNSTAVTRLTLGIMVFYVCTYVCAVYNWYVQYIPPNSDSHYLNYLLLYLILHILHSDP